MRIYIAFFLLFGFKTGHAQQYEARLDTAKAKAFKDQALHLQNAGKNAEAIALYDSSMFYYKKIDSIRCYFDVWVNQITCHINKGDFATAEKASQKGIEESISEGDDLYLNKFTRQLALTYSARSEYDKALTEFNKILKNQREMQGEDQVAYAEVLGDVSVTYYKIGKTGEALKLRLESIDILERNAEKRQLAKGYQNLGVLYYSFGDYRRMLDYSEKALLLAKSEFGEESPSVASIIENIGVAYSFLGQLDMAKEHYLQTLRMRKKLLGENHWRLGNTYQNLAQISNIEDDHKASLNFILKAYEIRRSTLGEEHARTIESKREIGTVYMSNNQLDTAENYLKQAVHLFQKKYDSTHFDVALTLISLGTIKRLQKKYQEAEQYLNRAIEIFLNLENDRHLAYTYMNLARVYSDQEDYSQAFELMTQALRASHMDQSNDHNIPPETGNYLSLRTAHEMFAEKIELLRKSSAEPVVIIDHVNTMIEFLDKIQTKISSSSDLKRYSFDYYYYTGLGTHYAYQLYQETKSEKYKQLIFSYSEKSKDNLLLNQLLYTQAKSFAGLPDSLIQKEFQLILEIEQNLTAQKRIKNDSVLAELKNDAFELTNSYNEMVQLFKTQYPKFYSLRYEDRSVTLKDFQKYLRATSSASLTYLLYDNECYVSYITPTKHEVYLIDLGDDFEDKVSALKESISNPDDMSYADISQSYFNQLIGSVEMDSTITNLLISADAELNMIPFEILQKNGQFLFEKYIIRYTNSFTHLLLERDSGDKKTNLIGFAPDFELQNESGFKDVVRSELAELPGAMQEVNALSSVFTGQSFIGTNASEQNFKSTAKDYGIIHLATHAIIDDINPDNSRLIFSLSDSTDQDGYLHAFEIYNLQLDAQLATLSACNTGFGKIRNGEGVMSLSRAFAYAGVPATVVSLWPASDKSTPELMKYFYQNLKDGQPKDIALNNARKEYLATANGKARHPFYWGGFVLIGDNSPIEEDTNPLPYLILSAMVLVMILTIYRRRKSSTT